MKEQIHEVAATMHDDEPSDFQGPITEVGPPAAQIAVAKMTPSAE